MFEQFFDTHFHDLCVYSHNFRIQWPATECYYLLNFYFSRYFVLHSTIKTFTFAMSKDIRLFALSIIYIYIY